MFWERYWWRFTSFGVWRRVNWQIIAGFFQYYLSPFSGYMSITTTTWPWKWQQTPAKRGSIFYQSTRHHKPEPLAYKNYEFLCRDESSDVHGRWQLPELPHVRLHVLLKELQHCIEPCGLRSACANLRYSDRFERCSGSCRYVANRLSVNRVDHTAPR
jgi:hypothetical protein